MSRVKEYAESHPAPAGDPPDVRSLRREVDRLKRQVEAHASGEGIIRQAVEDAYQDPPDLVIPKARCKNSRRPAEIPVLHFSDGQIGKVTADYDTAKADAAIQKAVAATIEITEVRRSAANIPNLVLLMGGDEVEGENIFPGQAYEIDSGVFEQAAKNAPAIYARAIISLLQEFQQIEVYEVPGNHGKNYTKGMSAHPRTNWDNVCHHVLRVMLARFQKRIVWHPNTDWNLHFNTFGWTHYAVHGDRMPWPRPSRISYILQLMDSEYEKTGRVDYFWHGHHHVLELYRAGRIRCFANGSPERRNDFAKYKFGALSRPEQRLAFFNERHGLIADCPLYLGD